MTPTIAALLATEREAQDLAGQVATWRMIAFATFRGSRELYLENQRLRARIDAQRDEIRQLLGVRDDA